MSKPKAETDDELVDRLVDGIDPNAKLPNGFGLWSTTFQLGWLRQNQSPATASRRP